MNLTMDEMIEACEAEKKPDEEMLFAIGTGRIEPKLGMKKRMKETMEYIMSLDGFIGIHSIDLWHTALIFDTLNNAKGARNLMKSKGIPIGEIVPVLVEKQHLKRGREDD